MSHIIRSRHTCMKMTMQSWRNYVHRDVSRCQVTRYKRKLHYYRNHSLFWDDGGDMNVHRIGTDILCKVINRYPPPLTCLGVKKVTCWWHCTHGYHLFGFLNESPALRQVKKNLRLIVLNFDDLFYRNYKKIILTVVIDLRQKKWQRNCASYERNHLDVSKISW